VNSGANRLAAAVVILAVCALHLGFSAVTIARSNADLRASDQGAEIWLAALSRSDLFPMRTDGVRHPLYSWVARWFHTGDKEAFFERGKWFNTILATLFLAVLGILAARWLDPLALANLLALSSMGCLVVRGTYFQPEPLYYILFFACCVLGWRILRGQSGPPWYPVFGALCGLAFLAKPSLSPFLAAFALGVVFRFALTRFRMPASRGSFWAGAVGAVALFAAIITPLGIFSREHFGKPFFNYPQVWMWMDDFDTEAWPWQDRHPGRVQLEKLSPSETPSPAWYFRRHSPADAVRRLVQGVREVGVRFLFPEPKLSWSKIFWRPYSDKKRWEQPLVHRGIYLGALALLACVLAVMAPGNSLRRFADPGLIAACGFVLAAFCAYLLLYGWYWPIGRGDRFMASLWIPCVFLAVRAGAVLVGEAQNRFSTWIYRGAHAAVLLSLLVQYASTAAFFLSGAGLTTRN